MHKILDRYPCDKKCKDGARFFFPCETITSTELNGYLVDVDTAVPEGFDRPRLYDGHRDAGILPKWAAYMLTQVFPVHERNNTIYRIAKDLAKVGLEVDDIVTSIIESPTYNAKVDRPLLAEIEKAVRSGHRKACIEMEAHDGRRKGGGAHASDTEGGEHHRGEGTSAQGG